MASTLATTDIPAQLPGYAKEVIGDEVMLYSAEKTEAVYLNQGASIVWALCDSNNTVADIVSVISSHYSAETESQINNEVIDALDEMLARNVIVVQ
jgi:hypothetical protein